MDKMLSRKDSQRENNVEFTIMGIDILPGKSPDSRKKTRFAMVLLRQDGSIYEKKPDLNLRKILELCFQEKTKFIAIDNIYEIVKNPKGVQTFAEQLPDGCSLVQVTGSPRTGYTKISTLAKSIGLAIQSKLNPLETSEIVAKLCLAGLGFKVVTFEDEVRITVSRGRSLPHQGGWSQSRYQRNIEIAVARTTRAFNQFLKSNEYEYDLYDEFGRRSVFFVQINYEDDLFHIKSSMRKLETDLARISINHIPKSSLEFIPLSSSSTGLISKAKTQNLIVGLDPGMTVGLAIIDLKGNVLKVNSKREFSTSAIIRAISEFGKAVIVAADVKPIPGLVEKIGRTLGAVIVSPEQAETSVSEKRQRTEQYRDFCKTSHDRDSLFAALSALDKISHSLQRTEKVILERYPQYTSSIEEIKRQVILGQSIEGVVNQLDQQYNIQETIDESLHTESKEELMEKLKSRLEIIQKKDDKIQQLQGEITFYQERLVETERKKELFFEKLNKLKRKQSQKIDKDRKIFEKNKEINRLKESNKEKERKFKELNLQVSFLQRVKAIWERGDTILLKSLSKFVDQEIDNLEKSIGISTNDVILILDPSGGGSKTADRMVAKGIRAVIIPPDASEMSHLAIKEFRKLAIPVLELPIVQFGYRERDHKLVVDDLGGLYLIEKFPLECEIRKQENLILDEIRKKEKISVVEEKKSEEDKHFVEKILDEYRKDWVHANLQEKDDLEYEDDI